MQSELLCLIATSQRGRISSVFQQEWVSRIAQPKKIRFLQEGDTDFEPKLAGYQSRIPKPGMSPQAKASAVDRSGVGCPPLPRP